MGYILDNHPLNKQDAFNSDKSFNKIYFEKYFSLYKHLILKQLLPKYKSTENFEVNLFFLNAIYKLTTK